MLRRVLDIHWDYDLFARIYGWISVSNVSHDTVCEDGIVALIEGR
jgi:hypothetical protein